MAEIRVEIDAQRPLVTGAAPDFAAALPAGGRLGGLDVGTKTIGLATCDAGWTFASPAHTIARAKFTVDLAALRDWVGKERLAGLVIGLPLNMDGSDSSRTQSVRAFARNVAPLGLPVLLWDERWSTAAVERAMIAEDLSRARRAERVDRLAASYILQGAIDALSRPTLS
jgi:putative holliday junction resolvase